MNRTQALALEARMDSGEITGYGERVGMVTVYLANGGTEIIRTEVR